MSNGLDHPEQSPDHIVVLVHGIRTQAPWAEMVQEILNNHTNVDLVIPVRYGFFNVFRFLTPGFTRKGPIRLLARELRDIKKQYPNARISLIAHSYGTYATAKVLEDETDIELFRLILCGSIVPQGFRWDKVADQVDARILNDCGTRDIWPVLATFVTWGFGPSGAFGFTSNRVRSRFHNFSHSDFFDRGFVQQYWTPYVEHGEILSSDWEQNRPTPPWWQSLMTLVKLPVLLIVIAITVFALPRITPTPPEPTMHAVCLVPDFKLRDVLPAAGGQVATPAELRISGDLVLTESPLFQRIYCMGGTPADLEAHVENISVDHRYTPVRDYLNSLGLESSDADEAYTLLISTQPQYLNSPLLAPGDELEIAISQTVNAETKTLWQTSVSVSSEPVTTIVVSKE